MLDIFETLTDMGNDEDYNTALDALDSYFKPSVNTPYERHFLRQMTQEQGDTIDEFCIWLKQKAKHCHF